MCKLKGKKVSINSFELDVPRRGRVIDRLLCVPELLQCYDLQFCPKPGAHAVKCDKITDVLPESWGAVSSYAKERNRNALTSVTDYLFFPDWNRSNCAARPGSFMIRNGCQLVLAIRMHYLCYYRAGCELYDKALIQKQPSRGGDVYLEPKRTVGLSLQRRHLAIVGQLYGLISMLSISI